MKSVMWVSRAFLYFMNVSGEVSVDRMISPSVRWNCAARRDMSSRTVSRRDSLRYTWSASASLVAACSARRSSRMSEKTRRERLASLTRARSTSSTAVYAR